MKALDDGCDTSNEVATADRGEHGIELTKERDSYGALAGDDDQVNELLNEERSTVLSAARLGLVEVVIKEDCL